MNDIMTIQEVADYLRVARVTMYRLVKRGAIASFKSGSDYRFMASEVEKFTQQTAQAAK